MADWASKNLELPPDLTGQLAGYRDMQIMAAAADDAEAKATQIRNRIGDSEHLSPLILPHPMRFVVCATVVNLEDQVQLWEKPPHAPLAAITWRKPSAPEALKKYILLTRKNQHGQVFIANRLELDYDDEHKTSWFMSSDNMARVAYRKAIKYTVSSVAQIEADYFA